MSESPFPSVRCDACGATNSEQKPGDRCWQCDYGQMIANTPEEEAT